MNDAGEMRKGSNPEDVAEGDEVKKSPAREPGTVREPIMARPKSPEQAASVPIPAKPGQGSDIWPDMTDLRERFDAVQSEFIEDPKGAVTKAEGLINDVVERLTRSLHERMDSMHHGVEGTDDTEQLRQTMRGYRDLVAWMETHRAA